MTSRPDTIASLRDSPKVRFLQIVTPQIPNMLYKSLLHFLRLHPPSQHWDLRTLLTVEFLRDYLSRPSREAPTVEEVQELTTRQQEVHEGTWKVDVRVPVEERGLEAVVRGIVERLGSGKEELEDVGTGELTGEWIGRMGDGKEVEGWKGWKEEVKYAKMMEEVEGGEGGMVILYLHGGAYFLCDPSTHRSQTQKIAAAYSGRCFLPRYRLAPQNPFPAALLDTLCSYLYLLHPPPGSYHAAIPASRIVFAGDSAGGGLVFAALQVLLNNEARVTWFGEEVELPLPGGVVGLSPWFDLARCMEGLPEENVPGGGSEEGCKEWDYLPTPTMERMFRYRASEAWDGGVKRDKFYAPNSLILHPLVSPMMAKSWAGAPPVWISVGDECLRDSIFITCSKILSSSVPLRLEHTLYLPHVFPGILPHHPAASKAFASMGRFTTSLHPNSTEKTQTGQVRIHPTTLEDMAIEVEELKMGLEDGEIDKIMAKTIEGWAKEKVEGGTPPRGLERWWVLTICLLLVGVFWK
ncbi:hypothetical protein RUND412_006338 [Rhizina undulata]